MMEHLKELPEYAKFVSCVEEHMLIPANKSVVVAVSGGADSVALLCLLYTYLPADRIVVAHVNHGIRGEEAFRDAAFVRNLCLKLQLEFQLTELDIPSVSKESGIGIEESARIARYTFLYALAQQRNGVIAVAHHREDRAETILMNVARGTGIDGLRGIAYQHNAVIRPLLDFSKEEILHVCTAAHITPMTDSTNLEDCTLRNRVRHHVLPYLSEMFNRDMVDKLLDLSERARQDSEFLNDYTQQIIDKILWDEKNVRVLDRISFSKEAESIQNRIIRKVIASIQDTNGDFLYPEGKDITGEMIKRVREHILFGKSGKKVEIGRQIHCRVESDRSVFYFNDSADSFESVKNLKLHVFASSYHEAEILIKKKPSCVEYFDYTLLNNDTKGNWAKIEMRHVRTGDLFSPFGVEGSMRLRKFLIDNKIPISHREKMWVVAIGNKIIWIPGIRRSNLYCITQNTDKIIQIEVETEDVYDAKQQ